MSKNYQVTNPSTGYMSERVSLESAINLYDAKGGTAKGYRVVKAEEVTKVTQAQVFPMKDSKGKLKALARVCLNDSIQLTSLRIYEGSHGLFVSYPSDPYYKGEDYKQLFYPVEKALRDHIEEEVLKAYEEELLQ